MVDCEVERVNIAKRIKELRVKCGMTVQELAYRCDMERPSLSHIEAGRHNITLKTMCKICNALDVSLTDLIKD